MDLSKFKDSIFLKNFLVYSLGLVLSGLVSFLIIPIILRTYGVSEYGTFTLVQNVVLIAIAFGGGWINQCVIRFNDYSQQFKMKMYILFFTSFLIIFFGVFVIILLMKYSIGTTLILSFTTVIGGLAALYVTFNQSNFKAVTTLSSNIIRVVIFLLAILVLPKDFYSLVISFALSYIFSIFLLVKKEYLVTKLSFLFVIKNFFNYNKVKDIIKQNKTYIDYGIPLALWFTISATLAVSDRYLIKMYYDDHTVGVYSSIQDMLSKGITMICSPILVAGYPIITKYYNSGNEKSAYSMINRLMVVELLVLFLSLLVGYFFQDFFITKIMGLPLTKETKSLILPLTTSVFLWQFAMLAHKRLELKSKTKLMLLAVIVALATNVVLNLFFLKTSGFAFAAYSSIASSLVYLCSVAGVSALGMSHI